MKLLICSDVWKCYYSRPLIIIIHHWIVWHNLTIRQYLTVQIFHAWETLVRGDRSPFPDLVSHRNNCGSSLFFSDQKSLTEAGLVSIVYSRTCASHILFIAHRPKTTVSHVLRSVGQVIWVESLPEVTLRSFVFSCTVGLQCSGSY